MGTNYYIVRKVDEESISRLNQSLQEGKIYQSEEIVDEIKSDTAYLTQASANFKNCYFKSHSLIIE